MNNIIIPSDFDISKLTFGIPKQNTNNQGKTIYLQYNGSPLCIQTPEMKSPFGVSVWPNENGGPDKYSIDMSFDGYEDPSNTEMKAFFDAVQKIDQSIVSAVMDNSQSWFKKKFPSIDVVNALYNECVRYSKDRETGEQSTRYAPTIKMQLPINRDGSSFSFPTFKRGGGKTPIDLHDFIRNENNGKGCMFQAIVSLNSMWIVGSKFGCVWRVVQLRVRPNSTFSGFSFLKMAGDDDDKCDNISNDDEDDVKTSNVNSSALLTSDDDIDV